ncbi:MULTISPECIES: [FeFe] hydrogenase H-cluster radical SAM maturase HydE [unclassified Fusibacter]|uniref:[FeFe] hydrogenase H-cluster radical SAM maturase HydE n=1 Tax=unclassified Fusibacter TaxID=2624464 RepID=UPI0010116F82|nr:MULTISPECIES: [FeFe] hydrogenase H-cluster radical SAM maturase HydE [unclassified Fusibacter]MCK8060975.1 [FeFe] hydrogenase H-cluster radical SAM maturase HydE [Fusibacter sp. A2]NPE20571.1 [FeFe] hydrogenase H-cluster radical SAM maturase HydE [Fusibacter sp. A1]RXV63768.1 [FeFe] hydrogenase H-cluster radical SAM maturase HydE [Fusibacter sp. A1]
MKNLIDKLYETNSLTKEELMTLLKGLDETTKPYLFEKSLQTKKRVYGDTVYMRGLLEISNICKQNCAYCGIRRDNKEVDRYRLDKETILACCEEGSRLGYRTFVIQGGEDAYYTDDILVDLIKSIKENHPDHAITLSLGERSEESFKTLKAAGVDRYLLRHETASKHLYEALHPGMSFENRRNCLKQLKEIGFQTGAGFMVGLPGQTPEDLVEDLLFIKELEPEMVGIGPFIPHKKTPIGHHEGGTVDQVLVMLAFVRMLLPSVLLPSTTALGTLDKQGREKALKVGANVVMPNLSPTNVREKYELYEDKICTGDEAAHCRGCIEGRIKGAGFVVDMGRGDQADWRN